MKMVKSLILGSAAGLVVMSGAQAADLPVKAKAVEYVRVCSLYGAGFFYIPGTDTCIKLGGYVRVDMGVNTNSIFTSNYSAATNNPNGFGNRYTNAYTWRSREDLNIDTRTNTEYGVLRTFFDATFTWTDDSYTANGNNLLGTTYSQLGAAGSGNAALANANNGSSGLVAAGTLGVYYAFIQFAGFTIGKAISPFSAPWTNYPGNIYDALVGGGGTVTGVNQFTYTAQFGDGVSGTIGFQDPVQYYQAGILNFGSTGAAGTNGLGSSDIGGNNFPDIVGNINITQAWGLFQLSAAAHDNRAAYYSNGPQALAVAPLGGAANLPAGSDLFSGHPNDKFGFAVQGALSVNLPTGAGDSINASMVYTNGATRYNIQDLAAGAGAWTTFAGTNVGGALGKVGIGIAPDSVFAFGGDQQLISTWGGRGAFNHNWNPNWVTSVFGAYARVDYGTNNGAAGTNAASIFCRSFVANFNTAARIAAGGGVTTCDPNYSVSQIGTRTVWTPVKNLAFTAEYVYSHLSQNNVGVLAALGGSYGTGNYVLGNQDTHQVLLRAQRNW